MDTTEDGHDTFTNSSGNQADGVRSANTSCFSLGAASGG
jgi:hypothetical protein